MLGLIGIGANVLAFILFGCMAGVHNTGVLIFLAILVFACISFAFVTAQEAREETGSCLFGLLMLANMIFSGIMLLCLGGLFLTHCGCA